MAASESISTGLHIGSMNAAAHEIQREDLGNPSVGASADVAVLRVEEGNFGFVDTYGARLKGTRKLACDLTIRTGKVVYDLNGLTRDDWDKLGNYTAQGDAAWDGTLGRDVRARSK